MPTGRSYSLDDLKSALKTRMAEFEMLNKTLIESIEKGSSEVTIDAIKSTIKDAEENIKTLRDWIETKTNEKDEASKTTYSFYNEIKKPTLPRSVKVERCKKLSEIKNNLDKLENELKDLKETKNNFFDNIKKDTNSKKLDEVIKKDLSSDYKPYDSPYNNLNYDEIYKKPNTINFLNSITDCNDEKCKDSEYCKYICNTNRFLVKFNGFPILINEWLVKRLDYLSTSQISVTIQDHLVNNRPVIADIREWFRRDYGNKFGITIEHLDGTRHTLYSERLHECEISDIARSSLDYTVNDFSTITMLITFKEVTYETTH